MKRIRFKPMTLACEISAPPNPGIASEHTGQFGGASLLLLQPSHLTKGYLWQAE